MDTAPEPVAAELATPWGTVSAAPQRIVLRGRTLLLVHRHGADHSIAPADINYRANLWSSCRAWCRRTLPVHTVGGIDAGARGGRSGGAATDHRLHLGPAQQRFDDEAAATSISAIRYARRLRRTLRRGRRRRGSTCTIGGVYGCTQGPRLETAAEIDRMDRDGCYRGGHDRHARGGAGAGAGLDYCSLCLVVNPAAGLNDAPIDMADLRRASDDGAAAIVRLLGAFLERL